MKLRKIKTAFDRDCLTPDTAEAAEVKPVEIPVVKNLFPQAELSTFHDDIAKILDQELFSKGGIPKLPPSVKIFKSPSPSKSITEILAAEAGSL